MKRILYVLMIVSGILAQSCTSDEDDVFDQSPAERMSAALTEYKAVLTGAPNGWVMEYYPEQDRSVGGYTYLCSFNSSGEVTFASEIGTDNYEAGETANSLYKLIADAGPVLSFDTYNEIFHFFSEPSGSDGDGYGGDYEFVFAEVRADSVIMKGKKYGNRIIMTPLAEGTDWSEYIQKIVTIDEQIVFGTFKLFVNDQEVAVAEKRDRTFILEYTEEEQVKSKMVSFIYTGTGLKFYDPLELGGVTMNRFEWNNDQSTLICTDNGVNARIEVDLPENYRYYADYLGQWTFYYNNLSKQVAVTQEVKNKTYRVSGLSFDFLLTYDPATGALSMLTQDVGTYNGYTVRLCPWDPAAGYFTWSPSAGMVSESNEGSDDFEIVFKDNGVWGTYVADGFLFWMFTPAGASAGRYNGGESRFPFITMIKQQ
jgi:hypothetical protein